jgi:hypothetical protein
MPRRRPNRVLGLASVALISMTTVYESFVFLLRVPSWLYVLSDFLRHDLFNKTSSLVK